MIAAILIAAVCLSFVINDYSPVKPGDTSPVEVRVQKGDNVSSIAGKLYEVGLIRNIFLFKLYVRIFGGYDQMKAGLYVFSGSLNVPEIVSMIVLGKSRPDDVKIFMPEGFNAWEVDRRLTQAGLISEGEFALKYYKDEGYMFPNTYQLRRSSIDGEKRTSDQVMSEMRVKMMQSFNEKTRDLLKNLTPDETRNIIIIASLLEKEARIRSDMKLVSGIIKKRLKLGMPLQVDAAVIYGACLRKFTESITQTKIITAGSSGVRDCDVTLQGPAREIQIKGSYNTYTNKGLPPGPISNPGIRAIDAALNPTDSPYLYYLSTRDGSQMIYSKTAAEHIANRQKYLGL